MKVNLEKPIEITHGAKVKGLEIIRRLLETTGIDIKLPFYLKFNRHFLNEQLSYIENNFDELFEKITDIQLDYNPFLIIRSSGKDEMPGKNHSEIINIDPTYLLSKYNKEQDYKEALKKEVLIAVRKVYSLSKENKLGLVFQSLICQDKENSEGLYGQGVTSMVLKIGFPGPNQSILSYCNGLNIVEHNQDTPYYLYSGDKHYQLNLISDYYSGEYVNKGLSKQNIVQNFIYLLSQRGNLKNIRTGEKTSIPKPPTENNLNKIQGLIDSIRKIGYYDAELELIIDEEGELFVYQFREIPRGDKIDLKAVNENLFSTLSGYKHISNGTLIGKFPSIKNKPQSSFEGKYQILDLRVPVKEDLIQKDIQEIKRNHRNEKILIVLGYGESGSIERNLGELFDGFIYLGGNVTGHAIGNTIDMIRKGENERFVVISGYSDEIINQLQTNKSELKISLVDNKAILYKKTKKD